MTAEQETRTLKNLKELADCVLLLQTGLSNIVQVLEGLTKRVTHLETVYEVTRN
jgi:hypothetical protein